jgi:hypothetical protein
MCTINPERKWNLDSLQWFTYFLICIKLVFISNDRFRHSDPVVKGIFLRELALTGPCGLVPLVCHLAQAGEQYPKVINATELLVEVS